MRLNVTLSYINLSNPQPPHMHCYIINYMDYTVQTVCLNNVAHHVTSVPYLGNGGGFFINFP